MSSFVHHDYSNINKNRNNLSKELSHISRFNFNNKNIKLTVLPHSFSQSKNIQYTQQQSNCIPRIIYPEKIKNFHKFHEKEISKKAESNENTPLNNIIEIKDLLGKNMNKPIEINMLTESITKFNPGKISSKSFGIITSYAANTNQGIVRNYNEDRVSIIINMNKPNNYKSTLPWPKISYFAVFDGHAGNKCAEYLRENLLKLICCNIHFPENIPEAIRYGFEKADEQFLNNYAMVNGQLKDNSGTCGLILLIVNDDVYIGNVGDSRCIGSFNNGTLQRDITRDHKPNSPYEKERIIANGGQIYQTKTHIKVEENLILKNKILLGPHRVFPGRLSVSRTIGDAEGKIPILGGNPNVIICKPDIFKFNIIDNDIDYFILGCDGIFDQLNSKDVFKCVSLVLERNKELLKNDNCEYKSLYGNNIDIHTTCGDIVDLILKASMIRQSYDNVTCLLICFKNLFNQNFQINNDDDTLDNINKIEIYSSIKRDPNILITSNSSKNYLRNNSNSKKNINIHGISKIIQKLRSGNSESSLFKKKEEIVIANEVSEYPGKPLKNIYVKNYNNNSSKKENTVSNFRTNQMNGSGINITVGNNQNHGVNPNHNMNMNNNTCFNFRDEKKNVFLSNKKNNDNNINNNNTNNTKEIQIIYKNAKHNNFIHNPNNSVKSNTTNNSIDKEDFEDRKEKIFYNKKKINFNRFKKKNESSNSKIENEKERKERESEKEKEKEREHKSYIKKNSRNIYHNKSKNGLNVNSFIFRNNNSFKNSYNLNELNNGNKTISPTKKLTNMNMSLNNTKKDEENDDNNTKFNKNSIDRDDNNNNNNNNIVFNNNFFTETKNNSNKVFYNLIKNKPNRMNLLKDFNNINIVESNNNSNINGTNNNLNNTLKNININNIMNNDKNDKNDKNIIGNRNSNASFQNFTSFKSLGIKKIYPSTKISYMKDDKKNIAEYNNHKYYYSNNNTIDKVTKNKNPKFENLNIGTLNTFKNLEPINNNTRNHNEMKIKYSSQIRSNTDYNYKDKKY